MSGYCHCACRDCFEITISDDDGSDLCWACASAGCDDSGESECLAPGAYSQEDWGGEPSEGD